MLRRTVLFQGYDATDVNSIWETNGTAAGTYELTGVAYGGVFDPTDFTVFNSEVLFDGEDANNLFGLWVTNGTAAGTTEIGGFGSTGISGAYSGGLLFNAPHHVPILEPDLTVFNGEVLFSGLDASGNRGLWVTNGTAAGTTEVGGIADSGVGGVNVGGFFPSIPQPGFTVFNGEVLFEGRDLSGGHGLWATNGTAAGTLELGGIDDSHVSGAYSGGLFPADMTVFNGEVLFDGLDVGENGGLWVTNGTTLGTHEITGISGVGPPSIGLEPSDLTVFNSEVLFDGVDASDHPFLWVTNGTAAGTTEIGGLGNSGISGVNPGGFDPAFFTVFNGEVLFSGESTSDLGLWVTNGTAAGTHEITGISGVYANGLAPSNLTVFNAEVLFTGWDASENSVLWVTNGTAAGTHELTGISGALGSGGLSPSSLVTVPIVRVPPLDNFNSNNTSDILFRNNSSGDTWFEAISNGAPTTPNPWNQIGGSDTHYSVVGTGDFYGTGTTDILFRNNSSGDTWFEAMSNGASASWHQIGGSDTHYSVAGAGDFYGTGTTDILFRNNSSGDTWFEAMSNGAPTTPNPWNQIGGSDTHYSAVGVGDFYGGGTDDILFRNNSSGDTWIEQITNGASAGWHQIGSSDTHYSVVGVGDFFANGFDDVLFRNNSTGDTWIEAISNGASAGWHQVGGSDTTYSVAGIGDYFGTNTSDILFRNASTGDTWFEAVSNGALAGWNQIGGSDTTYAVPVTVGPPALT